MILCRTELPKEFYNIETTTCIIATPYDAYRTSRLIFQSTPIGRICRTEDLTCFHLEDRVDEVKELVLKHRESCYPILDANDKVVGILTRYHLLRPRRKRVVLVDYNETAQSVPGLEEAEIVEIIDHHRVADIQTNNPIYVRNEPVGSTNTIIAGMFQDKGLIPSEKLAGLLAAAIISDTVMFKSPTCTVRDIRTAERMARYANISLNELGKIIFSASFEGKTIKELLFTDYKELDNGRLLGAELFANPDDVPIEETIITKELHDLLHRCINALPRADRELINSLYYNNQSERSYAKETGNSKSGINYRHEQILSKLRILMKILGSF